MLDLDTDCFSADEAFGMLTEERGRDCETGGGREKGVREISATEGRIAE